MKKFMALVWLTFFGSALSSNGADCLPTFELTQMGKAKQPGMNIRDNCKGPANWTRWDEALKALLEKNPGLELTSVHLTGWGPDGPLAHTIASAFQDSKEWEAFLFDRGQKKTKTWAPNDLFTKIYNEQNVGIDLAELFNKNGYSFDLTSVEKVFEMNTKELPFAKKDPKLKKSKKSIPYTAGIFYFKLSKIPPPPTPNETLWPRIDAVTAKVTKAKKLTGMVMGEALIEARAILADSQFEPDYQKIRAWAFDNNSHAQAMKLTKRAAPVFMILYDGDYDRHQIDYAYFKKRAKRGTEARQFLDAYPRYSNALLTSAPSAEIECTIPFDLERTEIPTHKLKSEQKAALTQWKAFAKQWKEPILKDIANNFAKCMGAR
jgi:hypothetical protein